MKRMSVNYIVSALNEAYQVLNEQPIEIDWFATANLNQCERNGSLNESVSVRGVRFRVHVAFFGHHLLHLDALLTNLIR